MAPKFSYHLDVGGALDLTVREGEKVTSWRISPKTTRAKLVDIFDQIASCLASVPRMDDFVAAESLYNLSRSTHVEHTEPPGISEEQARAELLARTNSLQANAKWFEEPREVPDYDANPDMFPTFKD